METKGLFTWKLRYIVPLDMKGVCATLQSGTYTFHIQRERYRRGPYS